MISNARLRLLELKDILDATAGFDSELMRPLYAINKVLEDETADDTVYRVVATGIEEILTHQLGLGVNASHVSYAPLAGTLAKYGISTTEMCKAIGVGAGVRKALLNDRPVSTFVLNKIAVLLNCGVDDVVEFVSEEELIRRRRFGSMVKHAPELYQTTVESRYNPAYDDIELEEEDTRFRSMTLQFKDINNGNDELFRYLKLKNSEFKQWAGLDYPDDNDYDN